VVLWAAPLSVLLWTCVVFLTHSQLGRTTVQLFCWCGGCVQSGGGTPCQPCGGTEHYATRRQCSLCCRPSCRVVLQAINKKEFLKIMQKRGENPLDDLDSDDD
jgi:hypothetical protein